MEILKKLFIFLVDFYRRFISPLKGPTCRFYPTCSSYAKESLQVDSLPTALFKITVRVCKCHPFHPGGYDPVIKESATDPHLSCKKH